MFSSETKAKAFLLIIVIVISLAIFVPLIISYNNEENKVNFPYYEKINIKDVNFSDKNSESYLKFKTRLENDYLFKKESLVEDFDSEKYNAMNIKKLLWNYIFAFEINNKGNTSRIDSSSGSFCLSRKGVLSSFKEFYNVDISNEYSLLPGYHEYVIKNGNKYCFNYRNVSNENNNQILLGIRDIFEKSGIITAKVYVYEFYSNETDEQNELINKLKDYISYSSYESANQIVENDLNGSVSKKELRFRINNAAKYFKFQILSSKKIDY